jgi:hypothetical protein
MPLKLSKFQKPALLGWQIVLHQSPAFHVGGEHTGDKNPMLFLYERLCCFEPDYAEWRMQARPARLPWAIVFIEPPG